MSSLTFEVRPSLEVGENWVTSELSTSRMETKATWRCSSVRMPRKGPASMQHGRIARRTQRRGESISTSSRGWSVQSSRVSRSLSRPHEREALELAASNCVGNYTNEHVLALRKLEVNGLVRAKRNVRSAWYELTSRGRRTAGKISRRPHWLQADPTSPGSSSRRIAAS